MTRSDFIDKWRHEIAGLALDGATAQRTGADLALWARGLMKKVDAHLASMFDQLVVEPKPVGNGQAAVKK